MASVTMARGSGIQIRRDEFRAVADADVGLVRMQIFHRKPGALDALSARLPMSLPEAGETAEGLGALLLWSAPGEWVAIVGEGEERAWIEQMEKRLEGLGVVLSPLVESHMLLALGGRCVSEILARGSTVDFASAAFGPGRCLTTRFAGITALLARREAPEPVALIAERSLENYLAAWLESASADL